jgi:hypothetical protein
VLSFGSPHWLALGVLAALGPVLLHLIRPRPPERAPLPTARFLSPQPHARIRISRRPSDLLLMALRSAFLLLIFGALADPRSAPRRRGTADVVLLDARADTATHRQVLDSLHAQAGAARRIVPIAFDSYAVALRALRSTVVSLQDADSIRVSLFTAARWGAWSPGTSAVRRAVWPGPIGITYLPSSAVFPSPARAGRAVVMASGDRGRYVSAALTALGYDVRTGGDSVDLVVAVDELDAPIVSGTTVIVASVGGGPRRVAEPVFLDGLQLTAADGVAISPRADAHVVATWSDGAPAAIATLQDDRCRVVTGIDLAAGAAVLDADFPAALERLANTCSAGDARARELPLDRGAIRVLAGRSEPAPTADPLSVAALPDVAGGSGLTRLLLVLALLVALLETTLAYRTGTVPRPAGTSVA